MKTMKTSEAHRVGFEAAWKAGVIFILFWGLLMFMVWVESL